MIDCNLRIKTELIICSDGDYLISFWLYVLIRVRQIF